MLTFCLQFEKRQNMLTGLLASTYLHEGSNPPPSLNFSWLPARSNVGFAATMFDTLPWRPAAVENKPRSSPWYQEFNASWPKIQLSEEVSEKTDMDLFEDRADRVANPMLDKQSGYITEYHHFRFLLFLTYFQTPANIMLLVISPITLSWSYISRSIPFSPIKSH